MGDQKNTPDRSKPLPGTGFDKKPQGIRESVNDHSQKQVNVVTSTAPAPKPKVDNTNK